jgi:hypothetical protein
MPKAISKAEFLVAAPAYYALAIAAYFSERGGPAYQADIASSYMLTDEDEFAHEFLDNDVLFEQGIKWLVERDMIEPLPDMFGPTVYRDAGGFQKGWETAAQDRDLPFYKYSNLNQPRNWLLPALRRLNEVFGELLVREEDFDSQADEWQPLPLDREGDPSLQAAIEGVDNAIAEIRADNGYAANQPEERNFVLEALSAASHKLKNAQTVCVPYLRQNVIQPLGLVLKRFEGAALAVTAQAAREAVIEFIKAHGASLIELIFRHLS